MFGSKFRVMPLRSRDFHSGIRFFGWSRIPSRAKHSYESYHCITQLSYHCPEVFTQIGLHFVRLVVSVQEGRNFLRPLRPIQDIVNDGGG